MRGKPKSYQYVPAAAILLLRRDVSTNTNTSPGSVSDLPPPGFDANKARERSAKDGRSHTSAGAKQKPANENATPETITTIDFPKEGPTAHAKTKAEEQLSISELASQKIAKEKSEGKNLSDAKKEKKKLTLMEKVKKEIAHYWDGTKLLAAEVRISTKLALKMAAGYELTRRENRQVSILSSLEFLIKGILTDCLASTDCARSRAACSFLGFCDSALRRAASPCGPKIISKPPS